MQDNTLSYLADLIIVCGACCLFTTVITTVLAEWVWMLHDEIKRWWKNRKAKKHDPNTVSGS